jgi:DNA-binding response OmpR family regulator
VPEAYTLPYSAVWGVMASGLQGLTFLVVEDEPLIAMDIAMALEDVGARVTTTTKHAMLLAEHDGLAGAIVDHSLGEGDSTALRGRLKERGIPFLVYSGFEVVGEPCLSKPATPSQLVNALEALVAR